MLFMWASFAEFYGSAVRCIGPIYASAASASGTVAYTSNSGPIPVKCSTFCTRCPKPTSASFRPDLRAHRHRVYKGNFGHIQNQPLRRDLRNRFHEYRRRRRRHRALHRQDRLLGRGVRFLHHPKWLVHHAVHHRRIPPEHATPGPSPTAGTATRFGSIWRGNSCGTGYSGAPLRLLGQSPHQVFFLRVVQNVLASQ
jgi:hypothetical protein